MTTSPEYSYARSAKSDVSDEWVNVHVLRPLAGFLVERLYHSPITPNQVTLAAIATGMVAAALYWPGFPLTTACAGLLLTVKDILDSADGQLARAKAQYSRSGRFLDSIGDFVVNLAVFVAIAHGLGAGPHNLFPLILALLAFFSLTLRVSYHVYYQTSYLHLRGGYTVNRLTEEVRPEDQQSNSTTLRLQRVFQLLYGWQDVLMAFVDQWSRHAIHDTEISRRLWYADAGALRFSGLLGLGTELAMLMVLSVLDALLLYLYINIFLLNTVWALCILYRRIVLSHRVRRTVSLS